MTALRGSASKILLMALLLTQSATASDISLPSLGIVATGNFYVMLRAAAAGDSLHGIPATLREPAARLRGLTAFLPDSLPLRTEAGTVLIVHRRNPKYRTHVERLLWRRLDPYLSDPGPPAAIPSILSRAAADLAPLCHGEADSIRLILGDIYRTSYPVFQASIWPSNRRALFGWKAEFDREVRPLERGILGRLSRDLALPVPDSSKVRIRLVTGMLPEGSGILPTANGTYLLLTDCEEPARGWGGIHLLRNYMRIADALAPGSAVTAPRLLAAAIDALPSGAEGVAGLPDLLLDYAIARTLESTLGWPLPADSPEQPGRFSVIRKHWDSYLAGGITLDTACAAIVSDAGRPSAP